MIKRAWMLAIAAVLLFQGCATLEKEECLTADWNLIGYEDGLKGYAPERIGKHRKACAEYGVTPNANAYTGGRSRGLFQYCTPARGFALGRNGSPYSDVCQTHPDLEEEFHTGFLAGRKIYIIESEISEKKENIRVMEEEIAALEVKINEKESKLSPKCVNGFACQKALNRVQDLGHEVYRKTRMIRYEKLALMALSRKLKRQLANCPY